YYFYMDGDALFELPPGNQDDQLSATLPIFTGVLIPSGKLDSSGFDAEDLELFAKLGKDGIVLGLKFTGHLAQVSKENPGGPTLFDYFPTLLPRP
ncbi:MAG: hypothetical protein FWE80_02675, partial [Oscillospiraceae bacterium]|nr:hypothetical protein [Oscillospiraceae bacterium]